MNIKTIIKVVKIVTLTVTVVPSVIDGAKVITKLTSKTLKNGMNKSETITNIKKDFELKREGVITVNYKEI